MLWHVMPGARHGTPMASRSRARAWRSARGLARHGTARHGMLPMPAVPCQNCSCAVSCRAARLASYTRGHLLSQEFIGDSHQHVDAVSQFSFKLQAVQTWPIWHKRASVDYDFNWWFNHFLVKTGSVVTLSNSPTHSRKEFIAERLFLNPNNCLEKSWTTVFHNYVPFKYICLIFNKSLQMGESPSLWFTDPITLPLRYLAVIRSWYKPDSFSNLHHHLHKKLIFILLMSLTPKPPFF